ncbi:sorting nexin-2 [Diorhabda carinulata]|uniref:sorting nexin-2 n=1 Tax=Diorhabda sublineata TaxID=1163346 RepID=UPI0024E0D3BE|nr:sorting nexin-2 [Diorhabda sublineata]XP_057653945.1 sorting nexin-2 [Diorhabda carinulata]
MANPVEPPPLFENVDILDNGSEDDLFVSAHQDNISGSNATSVDESEITKQLENIPISYEPSLSSAEQSTPIDEEMEKDDHFLEITITQPQKMGEGMGSYMAYRVTTRTNMPMFKDKEFSVLRRFSDFLGLHDKLAEKYLKLGRIVPPAPEKSVIGTTKIKISSQDGPIANGNEFVEKRRASLERYIQRTAKHPVLVMDPDFREFLECVELPKATNTSALSSAGVMRLLNKVGVTVNKITYKMDETDPWFEEKLNHIEALETQLRKLHASVEALVSYRKELANLTNGVSRSAAMLSACEDHNSLSRALSQLAETEEKVEALHLEQANTDFFIFCEILKDYLGLLGAIRDTFHERTKSFQLWQHAQLMLAKRRESNQKLKLAGKAREQDVADPEVIAWVAKVERGQTSFNKISQMIKNEMDRFEKHRIEEFKTMFIKYLENHMEHQAQLIKHWEAFLPEAKAIA